MKPGVGGAPLCPQSMEGKCYCQAFDLKLFKVMGISWEGKSMSKTVRLLPVPRWGRGESVLGGQISHYWSLCRCYLSHSRGHCDISGGL